MSSFVANGTLFSASFSNTSQLTSSTIVPAEESGRMQVFVEPTGVNVVITPQNQAPDGTWHSFDQDYTINAGVCDGFFIAGNVGPFRLLITPSAGSGSCLAWANAYGA